MVVAVVVTVTVVVYVVCNLLGGVIMCEMIQSVSLGNWTSEVFCNSD